MFTKKKMLTNNLLRMVLAASTIVAVGITPILVAASDIGGPRTMSPLAKPADYKEKIFSPDPTYENKPYSVKEQINIYGGKKPVYRPHVYHAGPI